MSVLGTSCFLCVRRYEVAGIMEELRRVRGMQDMLYDKLQLFHAVVQQAWSVARCYGYTMIDTPILEYDEVFSRTLGEVSDVISKETYTFLDREKHSLTMRPEFTASVVRAFITNGLTQTLPQKLFSYGPLFRHERPQKGRYRQFHQINCEFIGADGPYADAETLLLAQTIIRNLGLEEYVKLEINTLGDRESRAAYKNALSQYFAVHKNELSHDSSEKIAKNPLRILDTKCEQDREVVLNAPSVTYYLNDVSKAYYDKVLATINKFGIQYTENKKIVRGLDYYTHTVFEFTTDLLGSQGAVIGGGRYDQLVGMMGGPNIQAIGFGSGIERLIDLLMHLGLSGNFIEKRQVVVVVPICGEVMDEAFAVATMLRQKNIQTTMEYNDSMSLKKHLRKAMLNSANYIVFVGPEEVAQHTVKIKNTEFGSEEIVPLIGAVEYILNMS